MLAGIFITLVSLWYGQNHGLLPVAASDEAEMIDTLFNAMMTISVGLVIFVEGVLIVAVIRFGRRKGDQSDGPHIEGNIPLEILWTAIPAVIVLGISVYSFEIYSELGGLNTEEAELISVPKSVEVAYMPDGDGFTPGTFAPVKSRTKLAASGIGPLPEHKADVDLTVDVQALQFAFIFNYPGTGVTSGELHVPIDSEVRLVMSAQDVIHAFWVPELRLKQDIIPGQETELTFVPRLTGSYPIVCAELCGAYHGGMKAQLVVHSAEEYDAWLQSQIASLPDSDRTSTNTEIASTNSIERSDADYLAPLAKAHQLQLDADTVAELHAHVMSSEE